MKAYILIQAVPGTDGALASEIADVAGVSRVERVTGAYDLIAEADGVDPRDVVPRIQELGGVLRALASLVLGGPEPVLTLSEPKVEATGA